MYQQIVKYLNEQGPMSLPIVWGAGLGLIILAILVWFAYSYGTKEARRRMRRLVKKNEYQTAERFVMQQAEDGAMEIRLSKKAYKELRQQPLEGSIIGNKNQMVLRIKII